MNTQTFLPARIPSNGGVKSTEAILREYFSEASGISSASLRAKRWDITLFLQCFERHNGHTDLSSWIPIDTARLRSDMLREKYAPASINRVLATLRTFSRWMRDNSYIALDSCKGVSDIQLPTLTPKALPDADFFRIAKTAELLTHRPRRKYDESLRNKALVACLASSGCRISEILNLKVGQLDGRRLVNVFCGKQSKVRNVLVSTDAAEVIRTYIDKGRTPGSDYLFTSRYGGKLSRTGATKALGMLARLASSPGHQIKANPHAFRHRVGKKSRDAHGDVFAARRLGHADLRMVERYGTTTDAQLERMIDEEDA